MEKSIYKLESIASGYQTAKSNNDRLRMYRCCVSLLNEVVEQHKQLENECREIESTASRLNQFKDSLTVSKVYEYRSGRRRSSGYWIGREGDRIKPLEITNKQTYVELLTDICTRQMLVNTKLQLLKQYADCFADMRIELTAVSFKPLNEKERLLQNILLVSVPHSMWGKEQQNENPVLGVISGRFERDYSIHAIKRVLKELTLKKGKIGRRSELQGREWVHRSRWLTAKSLDFERYKLGLSIAERSSRVEYYVAKSAYYRNRLSWITALSSISDALKVLPFVDAWKLQYEAVNKLNYLTASKKNPYVKTICTERPELIGEMEVLECSVPIYRSKGIMWEQYNKPTNYVYYLGKSGSVVVDKLLEQCDWYHNPNFITGNDIAAMSELIRNFQRRLSYGMNSIQTAKQRRKEIATYARKLIWLESINMTDSKNAGNCLPGTIQFAKQMNLPCPSSWENFTIDARLLLRRWKERNYDCDRLFLPAIDAAVNRVKTTLASLTVSCYVPSVIR